MTHGFQILHPKHWSHCFSAEYLSWRVQLKKLLTSWHIGRQNAKGRKGRFHHYFECLRPGVRPHLFKDLPSPSGLKLGPKSFPLEQHSDTDGSRTLHGSSKEMATEKVNSLRCIFEFSILTSTTLSVLLFLWHKSPHGQVLEKCLLCNVSFLVSVLKRHLLWAQFRCLCLAIPTQAELLLTHHMLLVCEHPYIMYYTNPLFMYYVACFI